MGWHPELNIGVGWTRNGLVSETTQFDSMAMELVNEVVRIQNSNN